MGGGVKCVCVSLGCAGEMKERGCEVSAKGTFRAK